MTDITQKQLEAKFDAKLVKLEKDLQHLTRRVIELQAENKRLLSRSIRQDQTIGTLQQQIQRSR